MKPSSDACDRNKAPILEVLNKEFRSSRSVLEIGSGTGQHAVYFAAKLPHLVWHTSDRRENHTGINQWLTDSGLDNVMPPLVLDVNDPDWPSVAVESIFSANTAHIMSWPEVELMFAGVGRILPSGCLFCLYGPFNEHGRFTSDSNRRFHESLQAQDAGMGLRDVRDLTNLGTENDLQLTRKHVMPANNQILVFLKEKSV